VDGVRARIRGSGTAGVGRRVARGAGHPVHARRAVVAAFAVAAVAVLARADARADAVELLGVVEDDLEVVGIFRIALLRLVQRDVEVVVGVVVVAVAAAAAGAGGWNLITGLGGGAAGIATSSSSSPYSSP
jgi:hypothetical protein